MKQLGIRRFVPPSNARPHSGKAPIMICPKDKFERGVGLNFQEDEVFRTVCKLGANTIIACYGSEDNQNWYSVYDLQHSCSNCPNYIHPKSIYDPYYKSVFDGFVIKDGLESLGLIDCDDPKSYVYFISDGHAIKIGKAKNINKRIAELQVGNPNTLCLLYVIGCKSEKESQNAETWLHHLYSEYRLEGEWFDILDKINRKSFQTIFHPSRFDNQNTEVTNNEQQN